jgi:adenylosuccinate synthase
MSGPVCPADFFDARPIYQQSLGWKDSHDLSQLTQYINLVQEATKLNIDYMSCGVGEKDIRSITFADRCQAGIIAI